MVTYIYFVKCPNCEDEHFDFFDEAKDFALGCLSQKPIITQTEVCRNDFGECTDSADLGTVWSWEEAMKDTEGGYTDAEPAKSIFTKDDLKLMADGKDPEFDNLDNSVDCEEPETPEVSPAERKPVPDNMTIEELVEEMEENEDTVECTWCEELFDKSECRKEVDLGWLCARCEAAIKSRGETLTFRENNYWDFLDEEVESEKHTWTCYLNGKDVGTVEAATEEEAYREMEKSWYINNEDAQVVLKDELDEELEPKEIHDLGNEYDGGYPTEKPELPEIDEVSDLHLRLCPECGKESFDLETGICVECGFN